MRSRLRWPGLLLVGIVVYLVALAATLPAALAWRWVAEQWPAARGVEVGGVAGTLWSGEAVAIRSDALDLGELRWRLQPGGLLGGALAYGLELAALDGHAAGSLRLRPASATLRQWRATLPASRLRELLPRLPLALDGQLVLDLPHLQIDHAGSVRAITGTLGWLDAAAGLSEPLALGDLRAELSRADDGAVLAEIRDQGGPIRVQGLLRLAADRSYNLDLELNPGSGAAPELRSALQALARADAAGVHRLVLNGRL
jgi:general secretion pathway protein N